MSWRRRQPWIDSGPTPKTRTTSVGFVPSLIALLPPRPRCFLLGGHELAHVHAQVIVITHVPATPQEPTDAGPTPGSTQAPKTPRGPLPGASLAPSTLGVLWRTRQGSNLRSSDEKDVSLRAVAHYTLRIRVSFRSASCRSVASRSKTAEHERSTPRPAVASDGTSRDICRAEPAIWLVPVVWWARCTDHFRLGNRDAHQTPTSGALLEAGWEREA